MLFYSPAGELLGRLEAYSNALGVKHSLWSPDGKLLSIGSYDQCARLVSPVTWKPVAVLKHIHPRTRVRMDDCLRVSGCRHTQKLVVLYLWFEEAFIVRP